MKKIFLVLILFFSVTLCFSQEFNPKYTYVKFYDGSKVPQTDYTFNPNLSPVPYGYGSWDEEGHGNHRALVQADYDAPVTVAIIEWRRFDKNPEAKDVFVEDPTGNIVNSKVFEINNIHCKIAFESKIAGTYAVYYMPYHLTKGQYFASNYDYIGPQNHADVNWLKENNLENSLPDNLQQGRLLQIQSRNEKRGQGDRIVYPVDYSQADFYSMYPMHICISQVELKEFLAKYTNRNFLVFCEDRTAPIKMKHQIPYKWYKEGERKEFEGNAQPNEIYTFQIGVYAINDIDNLEIEVSDFGTVQASDIHCINFGGRDDYGNTFTKKVSVQAGDVQPLWFYVQMKDRGEYKGTVKIKGAGEEQIANISIKVDGERLENGGVSESWRMSRISWLDSNLGQENTVVAPYIPVKGSGNKVSLLNKTVTFNKQGLPTSIISNNVEILQKPIDLCLFMGDKKLELKPVSSKLIESNEAYWEREYISKNEFLELTLTPRVDFDGMITYKADLKALKDIDLSNVSMNIPMNQTVAKYVMGFGIEGGLAPLSWNWKWNVNQVDYMVWLGDYDAGLQFKFTTYESDFRNGGKLNRANFPKGWYNNNLGGATLENSGKSYIINAFGGQKTLKAGEVCDYDFRLFVTPAKPYSMADADAFKFGYGTWPETNVRCFHHAQEGNLFINYPLLETEQLKNVIIPGNKSQSVKNVGNISYKPVGLKSDKGSVTMWITNPDDFGKYQKDFFFTTKFGQYSNYIRIEQEQQVLTWTNQKSHWALSSDFFDKYWTNVGHWKKGEKHIITFAWNQENLYLYIDGKEIAKQNVPGKIAPVGTDCDSLVFYGDLLYDAIRIDTDLNFDTNKTEGTGTLLLDKFENRDESHKFGDIERGIVKPHIFGDEIDNLPQPINKDWNIDIYLTSREVSNHCQEIWALRSLGEEIFDSRGMLYSYEGAVELNETGGGYQWLQEQLQDGYIPSWTENLSQGEHCASFAVHTSGRWNNFYVATCDYLSKTIGDMSIFLDGIGHSGITSKRVARVFTKNLGYYKIHFHNPNNYGFENFKANSLNCSMEHLPYMFHAWTGEAFTYDKNYDYWFAEMSAIPFNIPNEMLEYVSGGNPYKGMIFGMNGRHLANYLDMLRFMREWGLFKSEMIGPWVHKPLVDTGYDNVKATVYKQKGKALICLASWNGEPVNVDLKIDYKALGLDKEKVKVKAPYILHLQYGGDVDLSNININPGSGLIIEIF